MSDDPVRASGPFRLTLHFARRVLIGAAILGLGALACATPIVAADVAPAVLGVLLIVSAALQAIHSLSLNDRALTRQARVAAAVSLIAGLLLVSWDQVVFSSLAALLGFSWIVDGGIKVWTAVRRRDVPQRRILLADGAINIVIGLCIAIRWPISGAWAVYVAVGLRLLSTGWSILLRRVSSDAADAADAQSHPDRLLGLPAHARIAAMRAAIMEDELRRAPIDIRWILTFLIVFFAIHIGRMDAEWNLVGLFSPAVAVAGDIFFALLIAYALIVPARLAWRSLSRPLVRRLWRWLLARDADRSGRIRAWIVSRWLARRMRFDLRLARARQSPISALLAGLRVGLPTAAVLIAFVPLLGVSWYFNTETWATGVWDTWAAHRTDPWREQMIGAVGKLKAVNATSDPDVFQVHPDIKEGEDFSFIVIGDTGEGDASQHALRDQFLALGAHPDIKFLVVSSDVIYPQGVMSDYEAKFYLPFKGFGKPIYAIPGNHDWYDSLEAFAANFFQPEAARATMRARRRADHLLTTTTEARVDGMVDQAAFLRQQYGVQCAAQRGPFFEVQTKGFALIAVDTGILRTIDSQQWLWLRAAMERSRGKFKMIIPGHPIYTAGHDVGEDDKGYAAFHQFLRESSVDVAMAGDTHDFEFYREAYKFDGHDRQMLHFVNGGGGAYISIGTALDWPKKPPMDDTAFYPRTDDEVAKLAVEVPRWKLPLWWWVHRLNAWPSSPEALAAAFASNRAPFFQSFVEVQVKPSAGVVRYHPYTANGRMHWRELQVFGQTMPTTASPDDFVEFTVPMTMVK
ncbi:MAG TPA: metallophosphoesterase [Humisphaera sp.]|nr:metallophosphoesterase [Humisphaera sp.]